MTAIEEMVGMDVLCSDKIGTLALNKLSIDKNLIEVIFLNILKALYSQYSCILCCLLALCSMGDFPLRLARTIGQCIET